MAQKFLNSDGSKEEVLLPAFQRLQRGLRRLASSMVGESVADDALQDAFIRLWTRRTTLRSEDEAGRLLTTTVKHLPPAPAAARSQRESGRGRRS